MMFNSRSSWRRIGYQPFELTCQLFVDLCRDRFFGVEESSWLDALDGIPRDHAADFAATTQPAGSTLSGKCPVLEFVDSGNRPN